MRRHRFIMLPIFLLLGIVGLIAGCGGQAVESTAPEQQLHSVKNFSKEELNAPLSKQEQARGAQVAAPPIR